MALFVQAMLSKVVNTNFKETFSINASTSTNYYTSKIVTSLKPFNSLLNKQEYLTGTLKVTLNSSTKNVQTSLGGLRGNTFSHAADGAIPQSNTFDNILVSTNDIVNGRNLSAVTAKFPTTVNYTLEIELPNLVVFSPGIKGKPRELKQIAQKANITIFGLHIDNSRITQDAE